MSYIVNNISIVSNVGTIWYVVLVICLSVVISICNISSVLVVFCVCHIIKKYR